MPCRTWVYECDNRFLFFFSYFLLFFLCSYILTAEIIRHKLNFHCTTSQRQILHFLLHFICLRVEVDFRKPSWISWKTHLNVFFWSVLPGAILLHNEHFYFWFLGKFCWYYLLTWKYFELLIGEYYHSMVMRLLLNLRTWILLWTLLPTCPSKMKNTGETAKEA